MFVRSELRLALIATVSLDLRVDRRYVLRQAVDLEKKKENKLTISMGLK
jgi:hypothetical protein